MSAGRSSLSAKATGVRLRWSARTAKRRPSLFPRSPPRDWNASETNDPSGQTGASGLSDSTPRDPGVDPVGSAGGPYASRRATTETSSESANRAGTDSPSRPGTRAAGGGAVGEDRRTVVATTARRPEVGPRIGEGEDLVEVGRIAGPIVVDLHGLTKTTVDASDGAASTNPAHRSAARCGERAPRRPSRR